MENVQTKRDELGFHSLLKGGMLLSERKSMPLPGTSLEGPIRFGTYEVDPRTGELRKHGIRIKLQDQPCKILLALLEKPGEVVTREELRQRIWGEDTFVDFDHGLSAAVNRLREALSDSVEKPRYVETLARRGYRFIAPVEEAAQPRPAARAATPASKPSSWKLVWVTAGLLLAGSAFWIFRPDTETSVPPLVAVPLTSFEGVERDPSFSPDAAQIAFSWDGEKQDNFDIYASTVGTGSPVRLTTDPVPDRFPSWSPDGRSIAFLREGEGLYLVPPLGGTERNIFGWPGIASPLSWSKDGRYLMFARSESESGAGGIFVISAQGGPARRVTTAGKGQIHGSPALSQDNRRLAFALCKNHLACSVAAVQLDDRLMSRGPTRQLTPFRGFIDTVAWNHNSGAVVFSQPPGTIGRSRLWETTSNGRSEPRLISVVEAGSRSFAISRTAPSRLAYGRFRWNANIWSLVDGVVRRSPTSSTMVDYAPQFSPDGTRVAFASDRSGNQEIWIAKTDGSHALRLTNSQTSGSPQWSPDGKSIVYDTSREGGGFDIRMVGSTGGKPAPIVTSRASNKVPSFSRDGKWVYFCSNLSGRNEIYRVQLSGGEPIRLTENGGFFAQESIDRKSIYYTKEYVDCGPLFMRSLGGGAERRLLDSVCARNFTVARNGIYYIGGPMDDARLEVRGGGGYPITVRLLDTATGNSREIGGTDARSYLNVGLTVSPDGRTVLFSASDEAAGDLMLIENFR